MAKRKLRRQLNLLQVIMLGAAGTIAAEIFVLTGHAAGIAGKEAVLALVIAGALTLPVALNYCELATTYPVTGGAMTYVGEGFGKNLIMFLVGSLDCLSSTFYAALSAVGFAYSLKVFLPFMPIVPVAIGIIVIMGLMHMRGVTQAGNLQIILGAFLLIVFALYVIIGLTSPNGFSMEVFNSGNIVFEHHTLWQNVSRVLMTIALVYNAYVGFEVIADDAEEITKPNRNIPLGILISLGIATLVYVSVSFVTIGTVPYEQLAGSETALTDAVRIFWPKPGVLLLGAAGLVATLTSVNSAMLSATREAFTLSREHVWPRIFSRLSHWRTPYAAILLIVIISCLVAAIGLVDFLSFISSAGYMFVLFWASLAMIKLRKMHPDIERPFKVKLFPLTAYLAAGGGVLIIAFADKKALLFLGVVIFLLTIVYYVSRAFVSRSKAREKEEEMEGGGRILVAATTQKTAEELVNLASRLAEHEEDTSICLFSVVKVLPDMTENVINEMTHDKQALLREMLALTAPIAQERNVPIYTKLKVAPNVETGIFEELSSLNPVNLVLLGWPANESRIKIPHNIIKEVLVMAHKDVGVLRDRGLNGLSHILVPVGTGPNARLALKMAAKLAHRKDVTVTALRLMPEDLDDEKQEDELHKLQEIIEEEMGELSGYLTTRVEAASNVLDGIVAETRRVPYDLMIIGAAEEVFSANYIFGKLNDALIDEVSCSMLIVRRYQPDTALWIRHQIKQIEE
jgi:amino acid transporter/nucleotide-binding universal stress UspA family protein